MTEVSDVVVVGGGIGGASLAFALAREGLGVTVLEATEAFEDRVRGESMHAWGLKEARDLGVEAVRDGGARRPGREGVERWLADGVVRDRRSSQRSERVPCGRR